MCLPPMIHATIRPAERAGFVAECSDIPVRAQGATREEAAQQLRAAVQDYFERDENPLADYVLIIEDAGTA